MSSASDALTDAAAEQPLEKARLARSHNDQIGMAPFRDVDDLLDRFTDNARELVRYTGLSEVRPDPYPVLLP
jgi:hypothetical protein